MDSKIIKILLIYFLFFSSAFSTEFQGKFEQGSFILGKTKPGSKVIIDDRKVKVSRDGYFVFGLGRDRKNNILIKVFNDGKSEVIEKKVLKRKYIIQKIDGLPEKKVTPPKEVYERIKRENKLIGDARNI